MMKAHPKADPIPASQSFAFVGGIVGFFIFLALHVIPSSGYQHMLDRMLRPLDHWAYSGADRAVIYLGAWVLTILLGAVVGWTVGISIYGRPSENERAVASCFLAIKAARNKENRNWYNDCRSAIQKLATKGTEPLITLLKYQNADYDMMDLIFAELRKKGAPAIDLLVADLKNGDPYARRGAAGALGYIGAPEAIEPLIESLNDEDSMVRWCASQALERFESPASLGALISALKDRNAADAWRAANALAAIKHTTVIDLLIAAPRDRLRNLEYETASSQAEVLMERFPACEDLYSISGEALLRMCSLDKARTILTNGLQVTRRKHPLLVLLGRVEACSGNIDQSVHWWAQAVHCQESLRDDNFGGSVDAYLYLHYVAEGAGLSDCSAAFADRVDQIAPGKLRLNAEFADPIRAMGRGAKAAKLREVLETLVNTYIRPETSLEIEAKPGEADRLLSQLKGNASMVGWFGKANIGAARRLGWIGEVRAIEPLKKALEEVMRERRETVMTQEMHELSLEFKNAIEEALIKLEDINVRRERR